MAAEPDYSKPASLDDFEARQVTLQGKTKQVFVAGSGPAVIVMSEMPGIYSHVIRFARWIRDAGFTVWMPSLFGKPGHAITPGYAVSSLLKGCISAEFRAFAANESSPVTQWLRALAAHAHPLCGGKGVGAIGMCFTGNFALSMMLEPTMLAPVLSQPSMPLTNSAAMHIAPEELKTIRERLEREDLTVLAYRFAGDRFCRAARFAAFEQALGERFQGRVLPDSAANPKSPMKNPHSVVTVHLIDEENQPTRKALDEIIAFFRQRLLPA